MPNHNGLAMLYTKFALMIYLMKAITIMSKWCTEVLRRYPYSDQMLPRRVDAQMMLKDGSHTDQMMLR